MSRLFKQETECFKEMEEVNNLNGRKLIRNCNLLFSKLGLPVLAEVTQGEREESPLTVPPKLFLQFRK